MKDLYLNGVRYRPIEGYGNYLISENGDVYSRHSRRLLKGFIHNRGYKRAGLVHNSKLKYCLIHRLVATAFIPNPDNAPQVNHINGCKGDNRVDNLEWVTAKENIQHAIDNNLFTCGIKNGNSKLTESKVRKIRQLKNKLTQTEIANRFSVTQSLISLILNNRKWKVV